MTAPRRAARGFTMVEMMVVVAILGVLTTLAVVGMSPRTRPIDVASRLAYLVGEASRQAVSAGTVRSDVVLASGSRRRTRIVAAGGAGSSPRFELQVLVEDPLPAATAQWSTLSTYQVPSAVIGESYSTTVGAHDVVPLETEWATFELGCYPDGSCDPRSTFFESSHGATGDRRARLSIMPLGGATYVRNDWQ